MEELQNGLAQYEILDYGAVHARYIGRDIVFVSMPHLEGPLQDTSHRAFISTHRVPFLTYQRSSQRHRCPRWMIGN